MSNSSAFSTLRGTEPTNIEAINRNFLFLRNGVLKADGAQFDYLNQLAQFFIDTGIDNNNDTLYRIRPVSQPGKYLALSADRKSIILKDIPVTLSISDSSHDFIGRTVNGDYIKFEDRYSNGQQFMSTDRNDDVILAGDSSNAWFRLRVIKNINSNVSTVSSLTLNSAPEYFEEFEEFSEKFIAGPMEIQKDYVSAKIIVNERMTASEE